MGDPGTTAARAQAHAPHSHAQTMTCILQQYTLPLDRVNASAILVLYTLALYVKYVRSSFCCCLDQQRLGSRAVGLWNVVVARGPSLAAFAQWQHPS